MKFALVGYGRMGRAIEEVARDRGHELVAIVDPEAGAEGDGVRRSGVDDLAPATMAFEFTRASSAESNVIALLDSGVAVVCGTTGWTAANAVLRQAAEAAEVGAVVAPCPLRSATCVGVAATTSEAAGSKPVRSQDHSESRRTNSPLQSRSELGR